MAPRLLTSWNTPRSELNIANEGPKTFGGMMTRVVGDSLGLQVAPVPYVSVSAASTDVVGGQVEVLMSDLPSIAQMIKAGKLRPIAVTAAIQRFNRDLDAILLDKEMAAKILAIGPMTEGAGTPEQMGAFLSGEHTRWAKVTKDIGILPE